MACLVDKILVGHKYDKRLKVTPEIKEKIIKEVESGEKRKVIAERYGISIKTIYMILYPEAKKKAREYNTQNWKRFALVKGDRAEVMRKHRAYKQQLLDERKLELIE